MNHVETDPTGRYIRYDEVLGRGSYKNVYKAFDTHEAMEVAWNQLQVDRIPDDQLAKVRFEVELLQRLDHKNIINLFAAWRGKSAQGKPTMDFITELMSSGTLKQYLTRARAMKLKVIRRWGHNLLEAITYLHAQNPPVMHRDLKCDNIFINGHLGEVKIGDLGLSGVKENVVAQSVIGTPEFMAPELYEEAYTEKVDIYAFGMCLLEMITMEYPYAECNNPAQIFRKVFSGEKPLSFQRLPQSDIKQVIGACLEREKRRPSANQLLHHPLFAEWESDDGKMTNITLNSQRPSPRMQAMPKPDSMVFKKGQGAAYKRGQHSVYRKGQSIAQKPPGYVRGQSLMTSMNAPASPRTAFDNLKVGQSWCFNSDILSRDVLIAKEKLHRLVSDPEVSVSSANDGGELRIALRIPVDGETKKVEFFFDPVADDIKEVVRELFQEFDIHEDEIGHLRREIESQLDLCQSKLYMDEEVEEVLTEQGDEEGNHAILGADISRGSHETHEATRREERRSITSHFRAKTASRTYSVSDDLSNCKNSDLPRDCDREDNVGRPNPPQGVKKQNYFTDRGSQDNRGKSIHSNDPSSIGQSTSHSIYLSDEEGEDKQLGSESSSICYDKNSFKANMALLEHCSNGKYAVVQEKLESGALATFADYDRRTPLHLAATEGHAKIVELLLSYGADIDAEDRWGSTPMIDAQKNKHESVIKVLVDAGAHVETRTLSRKEIHSMQLMQYAANGFYDMVREKLMAGAEATFADYDKRTPLHLSCAEGHEDVTQLLLINGGDAMFKDRFGATPIDEAVKNDHEELLGLLRQYGGYVPRHLLGEEEVEYQYGMDLVTHASRGRVEKVRYLLEQGGDVGFADYDRRTALHLACAEGHSAVAMALLKGGADPEFRDRWGVSSFDEAEKNRHEELILVMRKFRESGLGTMKKMGSREERAEAEKRTQVLKWKSLKSLQPND